MDIEEIEKEEDLECGWCGQIGGHTCTECGEDITEEECDGFEGMCESCAILEAL
jgi:hypothetical protein